MLKLELELEKIIGYNKSALFPILVLGAFLVYFFSVSDFSEENYHAVHGFFRWLRWVDIAGDGVFPDFKFGYDGLSHLYGVPGYKQSEIYIRRGLYFFGRV